MLCGQHLESSEQIYTQVRRMNILWILYSMVAYRVVIQRKRVIEERFDVKFGEFYVYKSSPSKETKFNMENDIPIHSRPLNIEEVNYVTLFDPPETSRVAEILVFTTAQIEHTEVSGPATYEDSSHLPCTSLVEGEVNSSNPLNVTTIEVPVKEEVITTINNRSCAFDDSEELKEDVEEIEMGEELPTIPSTSVWGEPSSG